MAACNTCGGDGLVGSGPNPAAKEGAVSTCSDCNGTGSVEDVAAPAPVEEQVAAPEEEAPAPEDTTPPDAPVENPPVAPEGEGMMGRVRNFFGFRFA